MPDPTIEDYYGATVEVEPVMASPGPMVDIEIDNLDSDGATWLRFDPIQARELGVKLIEASDWRG